MPHDSGDSRRDRHDVEIDRLADRVLERMKRRDDGLGGIADSIANKILGPDLAAVLADFKERTTKLPSGYRIKLDGITITKE